MAHEDVDVRIPDVLCNMWSVQSSVFIACSEPRSRMPHGEDLSESGGIFAVAATVAVPRSATTGNRGPTSQVTYVPPRLPKSLRGTAFRQGRRRSGTHPCASFEQTYGKPSRLLHDELHYVPRTISKEIFLSLRPLAYAPPCVPRTHNAPPLPCTVAQDRRVSIGLDLRLLCLSAALADWTRSPRLGVFSKVVRGEFWLYCSEGPGRGNFEMIVNVLRSNRHVSIGLSKIFSPRTLIWKFPMPNSSFSSLTSFSLST